MTMEERSSGLEGGRPALGGSTAAESCVNSAHEPSPIRPKCCEPLAMTTTTAESAYPLHHHHHRTTKRSFDVAFLVAPDEKLARRQQQQQQQQQQHKVFPYPTDALIQGRFVPQDYDGSPGDKVPRNLSVKHFEPPELCAKFKIIPEDFKKLPMVDPVTLERANPYIPSQPARVPRKSPSPQKNRLDLLFLENETRSNSGGDWSPSPTGTIDTRSAFTKVNLAVNQRIGAPSTALSIEDGSPSPRSSISPDGLSYQNSLTPPAIYPQPFAAGKVAYPPFLVVPEGQKSSGLLENLKLAQQQHQPAPTQPQPPQSQQQPQPSKDGSSVLKLPSPVYPGLAYGPLGVLPGPRFLPSALLPSTIAALTLPTQNICAKCNLSFRMTSDLVYHMRSHHKAEGSGEASRRRREEKLRCPVCDESFRERHHLTRHMTAHQDKESDTLAGQTEVNKRRAALTAAAATLVHGK